ncbi:hypothetical protein ZWY2020_041362 [Hordeum vulgare]|nr:hypothetical protein ZWY2020_041362 [Hordeum vulgare]
MGKDVAWGGRPGWGCVGARERVERERLRRERGLVWGRVYWTRQDPEKRREERKKKKIAARARARTVVAGFGLFPSLRPSHRISSLRRPAAAAPDPHAAPPPRAPSSCASHAVPSDAALVPPRRPAAPPPRVPAAASSAAAAASFFQAREEPVRLPLRKPRQQRRPAHPPSSIGVPRGGRGGARRPGGRGGGGGGGDGRDRIDALGRLLTRVLRHMAPELRLDMRSDGYVRVRDLLRLNLQTFAKVPLNSHTVDEIREAVRRDNKQRFGLLEEDGELLIRANQGHTVTTVTSESLLKPILSADEISVCVHGTYRKNVDSILKYGLKRMARLHVHFSSGLPSDGGVISGMRTSANILIYLNVRKALQDGMKLYISENKVILTEGFDGVIPVKYFEKIETWPGRAPIPF